MNNMNGYDNSRNNDYRAPYLQLDKQQMSDPFGWLQSQGSVNARAILKQMKLDDRMIDCLLRNYCPDESKAQAFANYRQNIGRKAIQTYKKWQWDNELKEGKQTVKLNESQLRKIVAESVKKVLKEEYEGTDWFDDNPNKGMFSEEFENAIDAVHKALNSFIEARSKELEVNRNTDARKDIERMTNAVIKCMTTFDMYVPGVRTC